MTAHEVVAEDCDRTYTDMVWLCDECGNQPGPLLDHEDVDGADAIRQALAILS